ncbi:hypothetical protein ACKKBG_A06530 [Auxenochlorella protothecoides x Auxenochlorella symbiontica]|uniref:Coiled-coil domain-containing protein n=1 Tax=Auxenochlorella protothecoides TaxID=3075 RepID=A0A1D1ZYX4_AUXPR
MAKKSWGTSDKVQEARERKNSSKKEAAEAEAKQKEEAYWSQHANPKGRKDAKREEQERSREEAAARRAEAKRLAAEEEAALAGPSRKAAPKPKLTHHQLAQQRERDQAAAAAAAAEAAAAAQRAVTEDAYAAAVEVENTNVQEGNGVNARGLDQALEQLGIAEKAQDMHPERRAKAAWEAYYEEQLAVLKEDKPGLRLMQYKSMIFENWQRSPLNPRNQAVSKK